MSLQMRSMKEFDPTKPAIVHDKLNHGNLDWRPDWAEHYRKYAIEDANGVIGWDGRLLDGWCPAS
jgi:hypothetical protein